jgi:hypothetical protein
MMDVVPSRPRNVATHGVLLLIELLTVADGGGIGNATNVELLLAFPPKDSMSASTPTTTGPADGQL